MGRNDKIPDICRRLGKILRYNAEMGDGHSTIGVECEDASDYMELMKIRYEDAFEYYVHVDPGAENIVIPKLIIQPLCENCFQHGLKYVDHVWKIEVRAWIDEGKWFVSVRDVLENLSIGGLCIPNIYTRMKIDYGEEFCFRIFNDNGAVIILGGGIDDKSSGGRR